MEQAKLEKIAETFKDEEFAKKIIKIKEKEELIKAFAEKGLELSMEEVDDLIQKGQEAISNGEFDRITKAISEDELKNVSGGTVKKFAEGILAVLICPIGLLIRSPSDFKDPKNAGMLVCLTALTLAAAPTAYKGLKAAGKGIYKAGSKVYNKVTGSNKSDEIK